MSWGWPNYDSAAALLSDIKTIALGMASDVADILLDTAALVVDVAALVVDVAAMVVDLAAIEVLLTSIDALAANIDGTLTTIAGYVIGWVDSTSGAVTTVSNSHKHIHGGEMYCVGVVDLDMSTGDKISIAFVTPPTGYTHLWVKFSCETSASVILLKDATWDQGSGTVSIPANHNDNYADDSGLLQDKNAVSPLEDGVLANPTSLTGTGRCAEYVFAAKKSSGGGARGENERVLEADTRYGIEVEALENSNAAFLLLEFYV